MSTKINDQLRLDLGVDVTIFIKGTPIDCPWCKFDSVSGKGSGIPETGKDWASHSNYKTPLVCPNCLNRGQIDNDTTKTFKCIMDDRKDWAVVEGKVGLIDQGTSVLIGDYNDIKNGSDFNNNLMSNAVKAKINGFDYKIKSVKPISLLSTFSFEAQVEKFDRIDLPDTGVLST